MVPSLGTGMLQWPTNEDQQMMYSKDLSIVRPILNMPIARQGALHVLSGR